MKTITILETTLERLIEGLESTLQMCYNVDHTSDDSTKSSAYVVGYCQGSLGLICEDLKRIKSQVN
jgi:hypothetical protein